MRLLILQHVPFEGPAAIARWTQQRNHSTKYINCSNQPAYPSLCEFDVLIIMGGPMSVNDALPWIATEINFIQQAIANNKIVLGVCLGAQMIAAAMGARVRKNQHKEIGWFQVEQVINPTPDSQLEKILPSSFTCLHWHGDTFDIPKGATHLYSSAACKNQAFIFNNKVVGLQFHLEFDIATTQRVADASTAELAAGGPFVQSIGEILADSQRFETANSLMFKLLDELIGEGLADKYASG